MLPNLKIIVFVFYAQCMVCQTTHNVDQTQGITFEDLITSKRGYLTFSGLRPMDMFCRTCAFVSNSGQLLEREAGPSVDSNQCVLRCNDAPVAGFERDVGSRTTIRVVAHSSIRHLMRHYNETGDSEVDKTIYVVWGPPQSLYPGGHAHKALSAFITRYNVADRVFLFTDKQFDFAAEIYKTETGKTPAESRSFLSTGWYAFVLMADICRVINVYGMINISHCSGFESHPEVPYHYYPYNGQRGPSECAVYTAHEEAKGGAHRFATEKKIFGRWAKDRPIFFHHPSWM